MLYNDNRSLYKAMLKDLNSHLPQWLRQQLPLSELLGKEEVTFITHLSTLKRRRHPLERQRFKGRQ